MNIQPSTKMKVSIIGAGAMGGAVARGLLSAGAVAPADMTVANPHLAKIEDLASRGVRVTTSNTDAAIGADIVIVAVKPWLIAGVIAEIAPAINPATTEVSAIVAGVPCAALRDMFGDRVPARLSIAMPNTAMTVRESMTFIVNASGEAADALSVFGPLGQVMVIEERLLPGATALASCGIAYAMRYVRAASEGGVELGFRASAAQEIVAQTLRGAVALLATEGAHPETEIDKVTTPGGLTIRGLNAMERAGFTAAVIDGLKASVK